MRSSKIFILSIEVLSHFFYIGVGEGDFSFPVELDSTGSDIDRKLSFPCKRSVSKLSIAVEINDVTSVAISVDPDGRYRCV